MTFSFKKIFGLVAKPFTSADMDNMTVPQIKKKFFKAVRQDQRDVMSVVMDVYPDALTWHASGWDYSGYPVIYLALQKGNKDLANFMIEKGADINAKFSTGERCIQRAITNGSVAMVSQLIDLGADIETAGKATKWHHHQMGSNAIPIGTFTPVAQARHFAEEATSLKEKKSQMEIISTIENAIAQKKAAIQVPVSATAPKLSL